MPVSGLVITLAAPADQAITRLSQHAAVTCGQPAANRLPVVIEAEDDRTSREVHQWIENQPEVLAADVVYVAFDDEDTVSSAHPGTRAARNER